MNLREQFEKLHPVPEGVEFTGEFYSAKDADYFPLAEGECFVQNCLWQGFQSGHAAGLEDAAKFLDEWNTAIGDDLAKAIRAMKGPK